MPDETKVIHLRHVLERRKLGEGILETVGRMQVDRELRLSRDTIADATIIAAPSSTKNAESEQDSEMHQTNKVNGWIFGMNGHVVADSQSKVIHSAVATPVNTADCWVPDQLLKGHERRAYGNQAYKSLGEVIGAKVPRTRDFTNRQGK